MSNQNDPTAAVYDHAYAPIKGDDVVAEETQLIRSLVKPGTRILDIGCGTGRHAIGLFDLGYDLLAVDSSQAMLAELQVKRAQLQVLHADVLNTTIPGKYDLIILMWNALAEIAKNESALDLLFFVFSSKLSPGGKVLINFDAAEQFDPAKIDFDLSSEHDGEKYNVEWRVLNFDPTSNTTTSSEHVTVENKDKTEVFATEITQKWWKLSEIESQARRLGFQTDNLRIEANSECYLLLSQN